MVYRSLGWWTTYDWHFLLDSQQNVSWLQVSIPAKYSPPNFLGRVALQWPEDMACHVLLLLFYSYSLNGDSSCWCWRIQVIIVLIYLPTFSKHKFQVSSILLLPPESMNDSFSRDWICPVIHSQQRQPLRGNKSSPSKPLFSRKGSPTITRLLGTSFFKFRI